MRIDLYGAATSAVEPGQSTGAGLASAPAASATAAQTPTDTTTLSSNSFTVASLAAQALGAASAMEERVNTLRQAVSSGQYALEPNRIAAAMFDEGV